MTERQSPEERLSRAIRAVLGWHQVGADIVESKGLGDVLVALEYFLPRVLSGIYPYWEHESLDGFLLREGRKTGSRALELYGLCILISDQTVTPIHLKLRIAAVEDKVDWMECRLGSRGEGNGGMNRIPYQQRNRYLFIELDKPAESIDWVYKAVFGNPQASDL